jgi:tRNA G18 (ribose-2'-O)-methylase SpoU
MKLVVIAHDIRSVHNVGSIFRTADAASWRLACAFALVILARPRAVVLYKECSAIKK